MTGEEASRVQGSQGIYAISEQIGLQRNSREFDAVCQVLKFGAKVTMMLLSVCV